MTTMSLHAQIACKPSRQTNHLSKRWGDKWRLIFVAIFSWKHKQYRRGWRTFEETNRLQSFLTKKKIEQLEVIYNRESNNKRRKKETMKTSRQTQCGKPDKRKGTESFTPVLTFKEHKQKSCSDRCFFTSPNGIVTDEIRQTKRRSETVSIPLSLPLTWSPAHSLQHLQQKYFSRPSLVIYFFFKAHP